MCIRDRDEKALDIGDQYMFGESILVCPVTEPIYYGTGSEVLSGIPEKRTVYLPGDCDWYDFYTGERYAGGQYVDCLLYTSLSS